MAKNPLTEKERASLRKDINIEALERYLDAVPDSDREFMLALLREPDPPKGRRSPQIIEQVDTILAGPTTLRSTDPELQALYEAIFEDPEKKR
jgi:hypothetical protein